MPAGDARARATSSQRGSRAAGAGGSVGTDARSELDFSGCFALSWPGRKLSLTSVVPRPGSRVYLLGYAKPLAWRVDSGAGLVIDLPEEVQDESRRPCRFAWAFSIPTAV